LGHFPDAVEKDVYHFVWYWLLIASISIFCFVKDANFYVTF